MAAAVRDDNAPYVSRQKDGLQERHVIPCREQIADELNRLGNACKIEDEAGEENRRQKRRDYRNLAGDELIARCRRYEQAESQGHQQVERRDRRQNERRAFERDME